MDPLRASLFAEGAILAFLGLLFFRRRSQQLAVAVGLVAFATLTTILAPAGAPIPSPGSAVNLAAGYTDVQLFGKPISHAKPALANLATHPATGAIAPARIRIPSLGVDAAVEPVGLTSKGLMDVPSNIWDAAWLHTSVEPGAIGQAVIDGHLDSVSGPAIFAALQRLRPGDRIYVSDADGNELVFAVRVVDVEPLNGFPTVKVFGPSKDRMLNLITCAGHFDPSQRTYDHRLVVFTSIVPA
jgi:sortase (surface protein transpeptidase)